MDFDTVMNAIVEDTKSGKLQWAIGTDHGGYWFTGYDGIYLHVTRFGNVNTYGSLPPMELGRSLLLLETLQMYKPLRLQEAQNETLSKIWEKLRGE